MSIKAAIDTNVLVSAFLTKSQGSPTYRVVDAILNDRFTPVYSHQMFEEYVEVLGRGYLRLPSSRVEELLLHLTLSGEEVVPIESDAHFPDPDDKVFYCAALACDAHLVTGNMKHYPKADFVVSPAQFCDIVGI